MKVGIQNLWLNQFSLETCLNEENTPTFSKTSSKLIILLLLNLQQKIYHKFVDIPISGKTFL